MLPSDRTSHRFLRKLPQDVYMCRGPDCLSSRRSRKKENPRLACLCLCPGTASGRPRRHGSAVARAYTGRAAAHPAGPLLLLILSQVCDETIQNRFLLQLLPLTHYSLQLPVVRGSHQGQASRSRRRTGPVSGEESGAPGRPAAAGRGGRGRAAVRLARREEEGVGL